MSGRFDEVYAEMDAGQLGITLDPGFVDSSSPRWHNISSLGFDEDGVMWVLVGDKGLFDPAQDETNILGKLIRIIPSRCRGVR